MPTTLTLGSLFDGIGGWLLAARHAGVTPVWASEIEAFPCAVTKRHFPEIKQLGDITKLDGAELPPMDIVCAGSPCQDLSIAGKRKGLDGERSGLFRVAVEFVRDMRRATDGRYPRFFVWENVPGAFSSNRGMDFRAVLEEIAEAEIPMPQSGRWADAGMVRSRVCEAAWRVLDAQYWGVPQRRRRIFLVADFTAGKRCAAEVLFEPEGYSGDTTAGKGTGKGAAGGVDSGTKAAGGAYGFDTKASIADNAPVLNETTPTLRTNTRLGVYDMTHADEVMRPVKDGIIPTLNARMGTGGNQVPVVHCIGDGQVNQIGLHEKAGALTCRHDQQAVVCYNICSYASGAMQSDNPHSGVYKTDTTRTLDLNGGSPVCNQGGTMVVGNSTVRRLTPLECERLQGLPDGYTEGGSDTARYKALGNGMAQPCASWVIQRIKEVAQ